MNPKQANSVFLVLAIAFFVIGISGNRVFLGVGIAFLAVWLAWLEDDRAGRRGWVWGALAIEFVGGINNVFDKDPPIVGAGQGYANTWPATYDYAGMTMFMGVTVRTF